MWQNKRLSQCFCDTLLLSKVSKSPVRSFKLRLLMVKQLSGSYF